MTYIELINRFWKEDLVKSFPPVDTKLYLYLVQQCNIRGWRNPFELPTKAIEVALGLDRKQIQAAKKRLKERGMIDYQDGNRGKTPVYIIIGVDLTSDYNPSPAPARSAAETTVEEPLADTCDNVSDNTSDNVSDNTSDNANATQPATLYKNKTKIKDKESVVPMAEKNSHSPSCRNLSSSGILSVSGKLAECRKSSGNTAYHAFLDFLEEEAPSVVRDIGPLTEREFLALKGHFRDSELIASCVRNLENRKDLRKRYSSLYRTLINWCKNGYNR